MSYIRIIALTSLAMFAFAGNALLCRIALKHTSIDAASFTTIRLVSGALMLWFVVHIRPQHTYRRGQLVVGICVVCLCSRLFFCLREPACGNRCAAALWRCSGNHDRLWRLGG